MNNTKILIPIVLISLLFILFPLSNLQAMEKQAEDFVILFSGNVYGETEPCG